MAVHFVCSKANALLQTFKDRITQEEPKGKVTTWEISQDGQYFTYRAADWGKKAWMKPACEEGMLTFHIIKPKNMKVSKLVYAYYHGHLIETFLSHFDHDFTAASASAMGEPGDKLSSTSTGS